MGIEYKSGLGAEIVPRSEWLKVVKSVRDLECAGLYEGTVNESMDLDFVLKAQSMNHDIVMA